MSSAISGPVPGGTVRAPRLRLTANGVVIPNALQATVTQTNEWTASRWAAHVALVDSEAMNAAWWASQVNVQIGIEVALDGQNFQTLLTGVIDEIEIEPDTGTLTLSGRDLVALLIDAKTSNAYQNQTASEVATLLAQSAGITPVVTATTKPVGQFYAYDHVRLSLGDLSRSITDWDLLVYLAQQENFDVFVQGTSLYFQPAQPQGNPTFGISWSRVDGMATSNVMDLAMRRSLTLAKQVTVTVKSWHSGRRYPVIAKLSSEGVNASGNLGPPQNYVFYEPNLTPAQATAYAQQKMAEITRHERIITFSMPGELTLNPRSVIGLSGTGTAFDQSYFPDQIERSISFQGGFTQSVTARNSSPRNQTVLY
ncbi:MAG TPA: hypothetical protein PK677_14305 [Acidiphilium sp.]|nr:hypothetical protein [Acidiphilium sp.]